MTTTKSEVCDVCSHEVANHDRIADRYCNATRSNVMTRGCICSSAKIPAASVAAAP